MFFCCPVPLYPVTADSICHNWHCRVLPLQSKMQSKIKPSAKGMHSFPTEFLGDDCWGRAFPAAWSSRHSQTSCSTGAIHQIHVSNLGATSRPVSTKGTATSLVWKCSGWKKYPRAPNIIFVLFNKVFRRKNNGSAFFFPPLIKTEMHEDKRQQYSYLWCLKQTLKVSCLQSNSASNNLLAWKWQLSQRKLSCFFMIQFPFTLQRLSTSS